MRDLQAPFPYFGVKRHIADEVWDRLGSPPNYIEPFAGSASILLNRPDGRVEDGCETISTLD